MTTLARKQDQASRLAESMYESCVGVRVGRLHRLVSRRFEAALRPIGLTTVQMEILTGLTLVGEPVKPSFIAEKIGVERSTMSRNLTLMETRGLVVTTESSASDRSLAVTISERGTNKLVEAEGAWTEAQASVVSAVGAEAPSVLDGWLDDLGA